MSSLRLRLAGGFVGAAVVTTSLVGIALHESGAAGDASSGMGVPTMLFAAAGGMAVLGAFAAWWVNRELAPLGRLANALRERDARSTEALTADDLPTELQPLAAETDAVLAQLGGALQREREFTGHVAHELRTPLAVLRTGLELSVRKMKDATGREADARAQLEELVETVDEMTTLVSNLLTLARVERGAKATKLEPVALRPVVSAVWRRLQAKASARELSFDNRVSEDYRLQADPGKLHIVVQNLLANAVSYTERGGSIAVDADAADLLSVWDSGPQLDDDALDRMFDRLWRADAARTDATEHAGLGLSLARALCRHMKMSLAAENTQDGGLRFVVTRAR